MSKKDSTSLDLGAIVTRRADYEPTVDDVDALVAEVERLRERLAAAETVCTIYGWTGVGREFETERGKATLQAWSEWAKTYGSPSPTPEWDERIRELAAKRDEIRNRTLARIRGES